ncbi:MAG: AAA family ATPase [Patescibacteria group bacterium]|nr:AAA family ATPase [Patescibacteria group bacterium]
MKHQFPILAITGARQVGKTTFLKEQFPDYEYYNLETPATLQQVKNDPLKFLQSKSHLIIDEIQKYPELFSYLQEIVDTRGEMDDFIIS